MNFSELFVYNLLYLGPPPLLSWLRNVIWYCLVVSSCSLTCSSLIISCQVVWLKEFKTFKDKSSAIRLDTGVDSKLSKIIMKWRCRGQTLVVGKPEYKTIIEMSMVSVLLVCFYVCIDWLWAPILLGFFSGYTLPVWWKCDGGDVGPQEYHAYFSTWRKISAD